MTEREVKKVRKTSIVIFSVLTVIIFFLSTGTSVTATEEIRPVDLKGTISTKYPYAYAECLILFEGDDWEVQIDENPEHVLIKCTLYLVWDDDHTVLYPYWHLSGTVEYWFNMSYNEQIDQRHNIEPLSSSNPSRSIPIDILVEDCTPDTTIYVEWAIITTHDQSGKSAGDEKQEEIAVVM
ncbi:MAG: hypothetical protein JSW00_10255 [Thermoplasmata archaeon]|nr:MAG: hypothetical protein JSW00_10255 [Thermoplasmata archaeon]